MDLLAKRLSIPVIRKDDIVDALKSTENIDKSLVNNQVCYNILYHIIQTNLSLGTNFILDIGLGDRNNATCFFNRLNFTNSTVIKFFTDCWDKDEWEKPQIERFKNPLLHQSFKSLEHLYDYYSRADINSLKPDLRHYGFNAPNPVDETSYHGYEMWVTIPDDMEVPHPIQKKFFEGGLYAAYMIPFGNFEEWGWLSEWVQSNEKYEGNSGTKGNDCMFGLLEEHLNYINHVTLPNTEPKGMQLDLLHPIREKHNWIFAEKKEG